jgi:hypothetical protein
MKDQKELISQLQKEIEKVSDWFHHNIKSPYYSFVQGVKNVFSWLPIIWRDREFDKNYLYQILHHKLKLMEEFYLSDLPACEGANKLGKQIKVARILCGRLIEQNYLTNALKDVEAKYGRHDLEFAPCPDHSGFYQLVDNQTPQEHIEKNRAYKHADYMEKQDKEYMFYLIKRNIDGWWD